jgi:hypothetical protein
MNENFWAGFEKEAKNNKMLERMRRGLPIKIKGQSLRNLGRTRLGKLLRSLK